MHKHPIILDLDCVVADISTAMCKALFYVTGKNIPASDWSSYNLSALYRISYDTLTSAIVEHRVLEDSLPFDGAAEGVSLLRQNGYKVIVCTNRSFHPNSNEITLEWLSQHGIAVDGCQINEHGISKAQACAHYSDKFSIIVDDHYTNIVDALSCGRVQYGGLIRQPWNKHFNACDRVSIFDNFTGFVTSYCESVPPLVSCD